MGDILFHFVVYDVVKQVACGLPTGDYLCKLRRNDTEVNAFDCVFLGHACGVFAVVVIAVIHLAVAVVGVFVPLDFAFVVQEHFVVVGNQFFAVLTSYFLTVFVTKHEVLPCVDGVFVVVVQFFVKQFDCLVEVVNNVLSVFVCRTVLCKFFRKSNFVGNAGILQNRVCGGNKRKNTRVCLTFELSGILFLFLFVVGLRAVSLKTYNIGTVHRAAARVGRVEVHVHVEQHVLDCQRAAVAEFDVALEYKLVVGVLFAAFFVGFFFVIFHHYRFGVAVSDLTFAVVGKHTYLRGSDYVAVRRSRAEEGVEHLVHVLRREHKRVGFVVVIDCVVLRACNKRHDGCHNHHGCHNETKDGFFVY